MREWGHGRISRRRCRRRRRINDAGPIETRTQPAASDDQGRQHVIGPGEVDQIRGFAIAGGAAEIAKGDVELEAQQAQILNLESQFDQAEQPAAIDGSDGRAIFGHDRLDRPVV